MRCSGTGIARVSEDVHVAELTFVAVVVNEAVLGRLELTGALGGDRKVRECPIGVRGGTFEDTFLMGRTIGIIGAVGGRFGHALTLGQHVCGSIVAFEDGKDAFFVVVTIAIRHAGGWYHRVFHADTCLWREKDRHFLSIVPSRFREGDIFKCAAVTILAIRIGHALLCRGRYTFAHCRSDGVRK